MARFARDEETPSPPVGLPAHRLSRTAFDEVCAGAAGPETLAQLRSAQYSGRRLLLLTLLGDDCPSEVEHAWTVLGDAERLDPAAVRDVLLYPSVGVWLARAARALRDGTRAQRDERVYLGSVAAAAALRAGLRCRVTVPVWYGVVPLPTVGQLVVPTDFPLDRAELDIRADAVELRALGGRVRTTVHPQVGDAGFLPATRHVATARRRELAVWLDDLDPYRGFGEPLPPARLDPVDVADWRKMLGEAWRVLTEDHPDWAGELAAGLTSVVPVDVTTGLSGASSSAAFGAVALPAKDSATDLAETLVHEFQHSKLNALADLVDLVDTGRAPHGRLCYVPWRDDPRPLFGVLHGIYAFVSVVEFLAVQRGGASARFLFVLRLRQLRVVLGALRSEPRLTAPGEQLVRAVAARVARCAATPLSARIVDVVDTIIADHRTTWRLCHRTPAAAAVAGLAADFLARRRPAGSLPPPGDPLPARDGSGFGRQARTALLTTRLVRPDRFHELVAQTRRGVPPEDAAFCRGRFSEAATGYLERIRARPGDVAAWSGLALCLRGRDAGGAATRALLDRPELVRAVHERILAAGERSPDPLAVAGWLGAAGR